jgi:ubiquinone/menaquinone biosynthesis C-methylase UbiE
MPKPHGDRPIKGLGAKWYAASTAAALKDYTELAQRIASQLAEGSAVLEVAPGPGYLSIELAKLGSYAITGLDLSPDFVKIAARKAAEAGVKVDFKQGSASSLPFPKESFDFLVCRAAFKNFGDPVGALQEMCRVLRPGGRGLIVDLRRDASKDGISRHVDRMGFTGFNRVVNRQIFKLFLLRSAYTRVELERMVAQASFSSVQIVEEEIGLEISLTK